MKYILFSLLLLFSLTACKEDTPEPDPGGTETGHTLTVKIAPLFAGQALSWSTYYLTAAGDTLLFDRIKFLISNFTLEKTDGSLLKLPNAYAYLSLKEGRDSVVLKNVPAGNYQSFRFMVGLDSVINHSDPGQWNTDHPLSPALNDMHWGWTGGYVFNVLEGYFKNNGNNAGFTFHVALDRNARTHSFVENYAIEKNSRIRLDLHTDRYFSNAVAFSLKNDGAMSHSGDVDPVMDKFIQNMNGIFAFHSIQ